MKLHHLFLFVFAPLLFQSAQATSFYIRPFPEFTETAPNIVRGSLSNIHTENAITNDGGKTIYTFATASIEENLKGTITGSSILVRKTGGTKDGVTLEIPSSPEFKEGEETVLFLSAQREDQTYEVTGLELGKFGLKEENGNLVLTGGIFNYTNPKENTHGPWTLDQLKEVIAQTKGKTVPSLQPIGTASPTLKNNFTPPTPEKRPLLTASPPPIHPQTDLSSPESSPNIIEGNHLTARFTLILLILFSALVLLIYRKRK